MNIVWLESDNGFLKVTESLLTIKSLNEINMLYKSEYYVG